MIQGRRTASLNAAFFALSDATRRAIITRLTRGEATVMQLAEPFKMSQPAISRHHAGNRHGARHGSQLCPP